MVKRYRWECPRCGKHYNIPVGFDPEVCIECEKEKSRKPRRKTSPRGQNPRSRSAPRPAQNRAHNEFAGSTPESQQTKTCPLCAETIAINAIKCKHCGSMLVSIPDVAEKAHRPRYSKSGVTVPVLISAISNILVGLIWAATCFGTIFAVPMFILCIFEFVLFAKSDTLYPDELASKARVLGIFEIIVGLANTVSLICGIIVLINAGKVERQAHQ